jgi:RNA polymerase sigma-70 factor (ECF subfamily)
MCDEREDRAEAVGPELLGQMIDRHGPALRLYAGQFCECPDDVVQDALIELARCREPLREPLAWLYRAVRFRAMSARRSANRRKRHEAEAARQRPSSVADQAADAADAQLVTGALASLPTGEREVVVAHVWGGLTFEEIGRLVGTSGSTAHRRFRTALCAIRERLVHSCREKS